MLVVVPPCELVSRVESSGTAVTSDQENVDKSSEPRTKRIGKESRAISVRRLPGRGLAPAVELAVGPVERCEEDVVHVRRIDEGDDLVRAKQLNLA